MDILLKAFLTRSSPSMSGSTQRSSLLPPPQNPSSHINILLLITDKNKDIVSERDLGSKQSCSVSVSLVLKAKERYKDKTHKLPLSSPILQPLPPRTLLKSESETKKGEETEKRETKINEQRERDVCTVGDEWSRKQSKSSRS